MFFESFFHQRPIAAIYDLLTGQAYWRQAIDSMLTRHGRAQVAQPRRVLDLGCGPGESAFALADRWPDAEVIGIDIAPAMIRRAERSRAPSDVDRLHFEVADATDLPINSSSVDLAIGHSFLYLVSDPDGVLGEARRVLRPGGVLRLMEPAASGSLVRAVWRARSTLLSSFVRAPVSALRFAASMVMWRLVSGAAGRLSPTRVEQLLRDAGFDAIEIEPTLGGLGLHCHGRRPAPPETRTIVAEARAIQ